MYAFLLCMCTRYDLVCEISLYAFYRLSGAVTSILKHACIYAFRICYMQFFVHVTFSCLSYIARQAPELIFLIPIYEFGSPSQHLV